MSTQDLIAGYAAYTDADELGAQAGDNAAGITPVTSSQPCAASVATAISVSVVTTQENNC
ncbi:LxmA leader domain family RiPP [Nocardioides nanhaiensis]|uniref:Thiocillin family RiPP n=1 Tax=Nocardioides nanhaiensis TaxID=1476871 RepID=A0ABP8VS94_9ACTN